MRSTGPLQETHRVRRGTACPGRCTTNELEKWVVVSFLKRWDRWNQSVTDWQMDHPTEASRFYEPYAKSAGAYAVIVILGILSWLLYRLWGPAVGIAFSLIAISVTWNLRHHPGLNKYRRGDHMKVAPAENPDGANDADAAPQDSEKN